jgi:hypothetical protein
LIQKRRGRRLRRAGQAGEIFKQLDLGEIKALQPVMEQIVESFFGHEPLRCRYAYCR